MTDPRTIELIVRAAEQAGDGKIAALFNNAGIGSYKSLLDLDDADWARSLDLNVQAAVRLATLVARSMKQTGGGAILNTASTAGVAALTNNTPYVVTKHALVGLTRSMAVDLGQHGIRTNALCPGLTSTAMNGKLRASHPEHWAERESVVPLRRAGLPAEQAMTALFLNSSAASYVNGLVAVVDGGTHALYASSVIQRPA